MNKKTDNKGFSLVELIIVIAIMAILIGVLAPTLYKYVDKSKESTDITNLDTCVSAVKVYYADKTFPSGGVTITGAGSGVFTGDDTDNAALVDAKCDKTPVKGTWTIKATVKSDGSVEYEASGGKYYEVESDATKGFKAK